MYTTLSAPDEVVIEDRGPLRAVVRLKGDHRSSDGQKLFSYVLRVHAYAGKPYLRVQHTFVNDSEASEFTSIRSLSFRLPFAKKAGSQPKWAIGGAARAHFAARGGSTSGSIPTAATRSTQAESPTPRSGAHAAGWAQWSDGARTATLALRDFWQNYPKDLAADADGLELGICPPLRPDEYAAAKGTMDDHRLYYYLQDGVYKLRQGVSKTHDIWLDFQPAGRPDATGGEPSAGPRPPRAAPGGSAAAVVRGQQGVRRNLSRRRQGSRGAVRGGLRPQFSRLPAKPRKQPRVRNAEFRRLVGRAGHQLGQQRVRHPVWVPAPVRAHRRFAVFPRGRGGGASQSRRGHRARSPGPLANRRRLHPRRRPYRRLLPGKPDAAEGDRQGGLPGQPYLHRRPPLLLFPDGRQPDLSKPRPRSPTATTPTRRATSISPIPATPDGISSRPWRCTMPRGTASISTPRRSSWNGCWSGKRRTAAGANCSRRAIAPACPGISAMPVSCSPSC